MPTVLQFRRGTTAQNNSFTGSDGELSLDTDLYTIRVHDGSTAGGFEITQNTATQTLTNKTLTSPTITGVSPTITLGGDLSGSATLTNLGSATLTATVGTLNQNTTGSAATLTTPRAIQVSGAVTGTADFDGSAAINIVTTNTADPTITLTGAVTGSGTMTNLGNVSITTTATSDPTITLAGDLSGSATLTNLGSATLTATIVANSVALGTDTTGSYVQSLVAGTGVTLTNNSGEGATPTIAIGQEVGTSDDVTFGNVAVSGTVDGRDIATDGTKLDTIETNADVTDATNVAAAGAAMTSNNLSDLSNASTARTNLGVAIGSDVQAYDADLTAIGGLTKTDGNFIVGNGSTWVAESGATARASLGLTIGTDVQAYSSVLQNTTASFVTADETKLDYISVTQAVDLDQMETDIAALANGMVYKGDWDASAGSFPGGGSAQTGWFYYVSVAGTVNGISFAVGDNIVATTDNASTSTYAGNWSKHDQTDAVQAVVGLTGSIDKSSLLSALNVEDGADVTDSTNVTAAGALMDSEVTNLEQVKAFDSSDYATAAQGTTADAALPRTGGAMTGAITTNSTFDGRDVAADGAKLDGIEAGADITDATNVAAAGALMTTGGSVTGNVSFGDNDKAIFGAGSDLQIYHDGSDSFIKDTGTGQLWIASDDYVGITNSAANEFKARFNTNGSVQLYYDNSEKLATTATGVDVTGTVTADGLELNGSNNALLAMRTTGDTDSQVMGTQYLNNSGAVTAQTFATGNSTSSSVFRIKAIGAIDLIGGDIGVTAAAPDLRVDSSGNVGIGSSTPSFRLAVEDGTAATRVNVRNNANAAAGSGIFFEVLSGGSTVGNGTIATQSSGDMAFFTGTSSGAERLRIDSSGKVGIGTSSPIAQSALTVAGNSLSITGADGDFGAGGVRGMLDLASGYLRMGTVNGGGSANGIKLITPSGGEAVIVDSSGHVGIGTTGIGTRANSLSIESTGSNSPWVAKSSSYDTVASILPWASCHNYIGTGVYYDDGAWVHASDTANNSLFALAGTGANWYSSNNSTGSWNVASNVPLWNQSGQWTGDINTTYDINTGVITGIATSARYADLAERYTKDADYEPGTVVVFGGDEEVTQSTQRLDRRVAGIVSTDPAYLMNSELENSVAVGLQGRVPCKVVGEIRKGDLMVSSDTAGHAEAWRDESNPPAGSVIGKALENKTGAGADVIEVVVGRM